MAVHILGIRHHGVGSAKNVQARLAELNPDIILVEGAPEISEVLSYVGDSTMIPPVAVMVYNTDNPKESIFYPFAEYSPEWIAVQYANRKKIPIRAIDLPAALSFAKRQTMDDAIADEAEPLRDPLEYLAELSNFKNAEEWWEYHFEQLHANPQEHFESVLHVMTALREEGIKSSLDEENIAREAFMRQAIRQAQTELFDTIVVVCGAWHAPALCAVETTLKADTKIIKEQGKSKVKIMSTWIPWTNSRLSLFSGYGAGIYSPGWYEHLWEQKVDIEIRWLTKVATMMRAKGIDISTAHVIEAFMLCRSLAELRQRYFVSLVELNDAVLSVMCMGDSIQLELVKQQLIVGNKLGSVPSAVPKVPLQEDFEQQLKTLKLRLMAETKQYDLDLRKDIDLQRSILFYRLELLSITWAKRTYSRTKGTFKESWVLVWSPEMMVSLIDKAYLGNTLDAAAHSIITSHCAMSQSVAEVAKLISVCLPAELPGSIEILLQKILDLSSISSDIADLMTAIPNLVDVCRYGNVRNADSNMLSTIVQQLLIKVFVGLSNACYGLDEDNSAKMFGLISSLHNAIRLYEVEEYQKQWYDTLEHLSDKSGVHAIILGCVCRLLLDSQQLSESEADIRITYALSVSNDPHRVAAWLEGFLKGNGMILIYDNRLWNLLYAWTSSLDDDVFMELLPLMRRTFSKFEFGERRQIGDKARKGLVQHTEKTAFTADLFDHNRAQNILPTIRLLLGKVQN